MDSQGAKNSLMADLDGGPEIAAEALKSSCKRLLFIRLLPGYSPRLCGFYFIRMLKGRGWRVTVVVC